MSTIGDAEGQAMWFAFLEAALRCEDDEILPTMVPAPETPPGFIEHLSATVRQAESDEIARLLESIAEAAAMVDDDATLAVCEPQPAGFTERLRRVVTQAEVQEPTREGVRSQGATGSTPPHPVVFIASACSSLPSDSWAAWVRDCLVEAAIAVHQLDASVAVPLEYMYCAGWQEQYSSGQDFVASLHRSDALILFAAPSSTHLDYMTDYAERMGLPTFLVHGSNEGYLRRRCPPRRSHLDDREQIAGNIESFLTMNWDSIVQHAVERTNWETRLARLMPVLAANTKVSDHTLNKLGLDRSTVELRVSSAQAFGATHSNEVARLMTLCAIGNPAATEELISLESLEWISLAMTVEMHDWSGWDAGLVAAAAIDIASHALHIPRMTLLTVESWSALHQTVSACHPVDQVRINADGDSLEARDLSPRRRSRPVVCADDAAALLGMSRQSVIRAIQGSALEGYGVAGRDHWFVYRSAVVAGGDVTHRVVSHAVQPAAVLDSSSAQSAVKGFASSDASAAHAMRTTRSADSHSFFRSVLALRRSITFTVIMLVSLGIAISTTFVGIFTTWPAVLGVVRPWGWSWLTIQSMALVGWIGRDLFEYCRAFNQRRGQKVGPRSERRSR